MTEANIQTLFGRYLQENWNTTNVFELKLEKGASFRFDRLAVHQRKGLLDAEDNGLYHKISDSPIFAQSMTRFTHPKPFDCIYIKSPAYVAICFYKPRKYKKLLLVPIKKFITLEANSKKKSATLLELSPISEMIIEL